MKSYRLKIVMKNGRKLKYYFDNSVILQAKNIHQFLNKKNYISHENLPFAFCFKERYSELNYKSNLIVNEITRQTEINYIGFIHFKNTLNKIQ